MAQQDYYKNPTDEQRHQLFLDSLYEEGRVEDYQNILELLSPPPDIFQYAPPGALKNKHIGIIGGGLAGMSAAYELRKLGADITIFEAEKERIGGRVYTYYFERGKKQLYGELGAFRIPVSHETTWHYINLFHLDTESLFAPAANNFIYAHDTRIRRSREGEAVTEKLYPLYDLTDFEKSTPWNKLNDYAMGTMLYSLTPKQRTEILKILPEYSVEYSDITKLSTRRVFEMLGLSQGAISLISGVDPFTGALLDFSHDEVMNGIYTQDFLNTYRITGGTVNLPLAFHQSLMDSDPPEFRLPSYILGKVDWKSGCIVDGISKASQAQKVQLRYNKMKGRDYVEAFDYVICAIPFSTLREIDISPFFSNQKMQAIKELSYCDAQKTLFLCKTRFWEEDAYYGEMNGGISFTDLPIQSILYPPDHLRCEAYEDCSYKDPGVMTASYNLGQDAWRLSNQNQDRRILLIKRNVEEVHGLPPGFLDPLVHSYKTAHWNNEQWFRGAFAVSGPGQKLNFAYTNSQSEYNSRVFFAGEHISTKQGWLQGALYTGKAAANQLAMQL